MIAKTGIRKVADDQIDLAFFQKFYTADRSAVGDFDPDIRECLMKLLEVTESDNNGRSCHWHLYEAGPSAYCHRKEGILPQPASVMPV